MLEIHELSNVLSDQISAGEVIENPASVVKELVENSIDAGSSRVDIQIEAAGLDLIKVVDNGSGIPADQVQLAFKRFATSKLNQQSDLFDIHTLGFRGEALPSIASVADVTMKTSDGEQVGTEVHIHGGKKVTNKPAEVRRGTSVTVRELFFNTKNRLKYLKSNATELSKITEVVNRLALGHPEVAIQLQHNGKEILRTSGRGNMQQVIAGIYGNQAMKKMVKLNQQNDKYQISGFTSLPELTRASRKYISVIINGRFVNDYTLNHAIVDGYGSKLMVGRYPVSVISIEMDPTLIDVNVHPTKQEVRLLDSQDLGDFISKSIYAVLSEQNLIPDALDNKTLKRGLSEHNSVEVALNFDELDEKTDDTEPIVGAKTNNSQTLQTISKVEPRNNENQPIIIKNKTELDSPAVLEFKANYLKERVNSAFGEEVAKPERFPRLRFIGQVHGTYLIAESSKGMYIIDQHAAQERINYENFRTQVGEVSDSEQNLLVPIVLDYPTADALIIKSKLDLLAEAGLNLDSFGNNSFVVHQHPTWFEKGKEEETIREMIDWILKDNKLTTAAYREKAAIMMSCKQAIKANHYLDQKQAQALLDNLHHCENPFNCPHGRPVLIHFSPVDLQTMFKRIQDPHESDVWD
ncbi:DNA mismatch repair endonuclease MutL [Fructilactobacillus vespulae]|uniref:DNA mismatch repair endonuclease MutL n=1 Tax=Fructilactobacillus vespulae TaxID=1249630 RepID=UPI0039B6CC06